MLYHWAIVGVELQTNALNCSLFLLTFGLKQTQNGKRIGILVASLATFNQLQNPAAIENTAPYFVQTAWPQAS